MNKILFIAFLTIAMDSNAQIPTDGLVLWYPNNGNAINNVRNGNDGVVNGATLTIDRFSTYNSAYSFDGISNKIIIANSDTVDFSNGVTFSAWVKSTKYANSSIIDRIQNNGSGFRINLRNDGYIWAQAGNYNTISSAKSKSSFAPNSWLFVTGTWDINGELKIFVNGKFEGSNYNLFDMSSVYSIYLGDGQRTEDFEPFSGSIDDIRIYNRALSMSEITSLFALQCPTTSLKGYYNFHGDANDMSGNGMDGVVQGATISSDRFGHVNSAYLFDGVSNEIPLMNSDKIDFSKGFNGRSG